MSECFFKRNKQDTFRLPRAFFRCPCACFLLLCLLPSDAEWTESWALPASEVVSTTSEELDPFPVKRRECRRRRSAPAVGTARAALRRAREQKRRAIAPHALW